MGYIGVITHLGGFFPDPFDKYAQIVKFGSFSHPKVSVGWVALPPTTGIATLKVGG